MVKKKRKENREAKGNWNEDQSGENDAQQSLEKL
jgi:hypothetical protein